MKLRDEHKLKEKTEWGLDRPYIPYAVVLAIAVAVFISYSYGVSSAASDAQEGAGTPRVRSDMLGGSKPSAAKHQRKTWSYLEDLAGLQSWNRLTQWRETPLLDMDPADRDFVMLREDAVEERRKEEARIKEADQRDAVATATQANLMTVQGVSDTEEVLAPETATREGSPTRNSGIRMPDPSTAVTGRRVVAPALTVPKETSTAQPTAARTSTAATATGAATAASRVDASAATAADVQAQPFAVQAKSFADEALATEFADNLRRKIKSYPRKAFEHGMPEVYVAQAVLKAGEPPWNRVRIGHFSTRTAANQFKLVLEQREGYEVWIVDR